MGLWATLDVAQKRDPVLSAVRANITRMNHPWEYAITISFARKKIWKKNVPRSSELCMQWSEPSETLVRI